MKISIDPEAKWPLSRTNIFAYVGGNPPSSTDPEGLLFGINAGEEYGNSAAQYWAEKQVQTGNWLYAIPGVFASLWTPCTSNQTFLSLVSPNAGARALPAGARLLPNSIKGQIGETASIVSNWLKGSKLIDTQVRIPGLRTIADSSWRAINGTAYYVESKFGTAGLTAAQRAARDALGGAYHIEKWTYAWVSRVGAFLGVGAGGVAAASDCSCK